MKLKNVLIVVSDLEEALGYYKNLFGLQPLLKREGNVILTEGLVLQDAAVWQEALDGAPNTIHHNSSELYFEESDIDSFLQKLNSCWPGTRFVTPLTELESGKKIVRFYDPYGNLIEVGTPGGQHL